MGDASVEGAVGGMVSPVTAANISARPARRLLYLALAVGAAFAFYWLSSFVLEARQGTRHFGADAHLYAPLAKGQVSDRVARFHPVTVGMALAWMKILGPVTTWVTPAHLLKAMFAAVGALGVWAAWAAFATLVPRGYAALLAAIYATSLGIWYFASIEESKIVTASLTALYIAGYLRLRDRWTIRGAVLLTAILLLACLNEIVSGFLIIIPIVDTLARHGWSWRHGRWITAHALAGPLALVILEGIIDPSLPPAAPDADGRTHFGMLLFYVTKNPHGLINLYGFVLNWLLFNVAAPTVDTPLWPNDGGYFARELAGYFTSPISTGVIVLLCVMILAGALLRGARPSAPPGILAALAAYALVRGAFFFAFNPPEALLFSPGVTLVHMLLVGVPFAASRVPAKRVLLAAFAILLLVNNAAFILGPLRPP